MDHDLGLSGRDHDLGLGRRDHDLGPSAGEITISD
jgi:hypothetical protein